MILAVSGSREGMTPQQRRALVVLIHMWGATGLVHGDCRGVDAEADEVAQNKGCLRYIYPSNLHSTRAHRDRWGAQPLAKPADPLTRNGWIVEMGNALAAFPRPSSRGTWDAVRKAERLGRPVVVIGEDGHAFGSR